jgi:hypothetical protein
VDDPTSLKSPSGQTVHVSVAPVLNVLAGQATAAVLNPFTLKPASTVMQ